jgi:uncharacterized HAD superfamily protein
MEKDFKDFQIEEYKNIANAHFETNKQIGVFFRYFLLIAAAPSFIFIWFGKGNPKFIDNLLFGSKEFITTNLFIGFFLIFISIIGVLASFYLVGLKLDNILYARTINGVRKYFFKISGIKNEEHYRVLPLQTNVPSYFDHHTFGVLYYAIAIINSIYFSIGVRIVAGVGNYFFPDYLNIKPIIQNFNLWWSTMTFAFIFFCHILYYLFASKYRRIIYLKTRIIGIDIDGVLNKHRETFCEIHNKNLLKKFSGKIPENKNLKPEEINRIPVSLIKDKVIDKNDEFDVFNNPNYWQGQNIIEKEVAKTIKELKNGFGYVINIHTNRPWPQYLYGDLIKKEDNLWKNMSLKKITKTWLKDNSIDYDNLFLERYTLDSSKRSLSFWNLLNISTASIKNRYYYTSKRPYRYFVEDDLDNAIKLAVNCEFVFLIDQPYNQIPKDELPNNIIRVNNWAEIKEKIKKLG